MQPIRLLAALLPFLILPTAAEAAGRYFAPAQESASAAIAADSAGGLHAAHTGYDGETGDFVYYSACTASCENAGNWRSVTLPLADPQILQVAVTPDGRPRLMIGSSTYVSGASTLFTYAECDTACTEAANWTLVPVANKADGTFGNIFLYRIPQHSFAVDGEGRPWFAYTDANYGAEPDHYGTFVTTCAADCTDPENWTETNVAVRLPERYTTEYWDQVALAVTPDGRPRLLGKVYPLDEEGNQIENGEGLFYYECDAGCDTRTNWRRTRIIDTGSGSYPNPGWDLEVLPDGRPRAAFFTGSSMLQPSLDNSLLYLWCDSACDKDANWYGHGLTAKGDGESPDLALTASGAPRLVFLGGYGDLGYLACDIDCESDKGQWSLALQDSTDAAAADRPTALPYTCDAELWHGLIPRLAVAGDKPWFAYDLVVEARCLYKEFGEPEITYQFHELWRGARLSWGDGTLVPPPSGASATSLRR
ncbi:MAG: hypothetical protein EOP22_08700 [Hyphomicrobiales bacterium]|nr:MAG: hypothetical protein EOP22_08700 [Hyphomicrobiales bacterium]